MLALGFDLRVFDRCPDVLVLDMQDTDLNHELSGDAWRALGSAIGETHAGLRADVYLAKVYPFHTRSTWQKRMDGGEVLINRRRVKSNYKLKLLDVVHFFHPQEVEPEVDRDIRVLWHKGAVMAVFKPGNLPMHENGAYRKNTFAQIVADTIGPEWSAVHRLDRETSGIVLCGATNEVRQKLAADFESKKMAKEYQLIVHGVPNQTSWSVDGPIGDLADSKIRIKKWVVSGGLPAQTSFVVEDTKTSSEGAFALLRAFPKTGRTNQIRIHAAYSGHWILGDKLYHPNEEVFLDYWESQETTTFCVEQTLFHRCCLHAAALTFKHPETGEEIRVDAELPPDMQGLWGR
jgi:23S rRNA pseudouridine1911/1915/1917 synthase